MAAARSWSAGPGLPVWRLKVLLWLIAAFSLLLIGKLFYVQVIQNEFLGGKAQAAHSGLRELPAPRGRITDRHGLMLAANRTAYRLYAEPRYIKDPAAAAIALSPIVRQPAVDLQRKLTGAGLWVSLATRLTEEQREAVLAVKRDLKLKGIGLESMPARRYPNGSLASHVLGFTNFENTGSYGVEGEYDRYLSGDPGQIVAERDQGGNWLSIGQRQVTPAKPGADVELTIDSSIQYLAETELKRTVGEQGAKGGSIIVMEPTTGEILAMASYPDYQPEAFNAVKNAGRFTNPAISSMYEPGSTFKVLTMAAGLDEGVVTPDTRMDDPGYQRVGGLTIHNWDGRGHANQSMTEVLINSSNVGAAYVSTHVGKEAFYRKLQDFGLGASTGVDLQGEGNGMLVLPSSKHWSPINLYTNAFGQGIGVTPLQLITAEAAVANGGLLMRPYVVKRVIRDGKVIKENTPQVVRRVLKPEVATTLKGMMQTVVDKGSYDAVRVPGYSIAAKTGTAQIAHRGLYDGQSTIASIVAYSPVKAPEFITLVKIDKPTKSPWAMAVAAPAFQRLAEQLFPYLNLPPDRIDEDELLSSSEAVR